MSDLIKVANAKNRRWIVFFISLVSLLFLFLVLLILPEVDFVIVPKNTSVSADVTVKFDLDAPGPIVDLVVVPAINSGAQASSILRNTQYRNFSYNGQLISYKYQDCVKVLQHQINKLIPDGFITVGDLVIKKLGELEDSVSGRQFSQKFNVSQIIMEQFPLESWQQTISRKTREEAFQWLIKQPNILEVRVQEKFTFLAKISKIILNYQPRFKVTLDR